MSIMHEREDGNTILKRPPLVKQTNGDKRKMPPQRKAHPQQLHQQRKEEGQTPTPPLLKNCHFF